MSIGFNEVFEFIFKNGYLDIFNFEPGILHFYPSVASLHLSNQFMYHMTISGNCLFVSVHKNAKKKKEEEEELCQYPAILTSRLVNSTDEHISCRPIQKIWQKKKMHFRARNLSNVKVSGLPFPCNSVH